MPQISTTSSSFMVLDDFRYMRLGKQYATLTSEDARLLAPLHKKLGKKKQRALLLLHGFASSPAVFRLFTDSIQGYDLLAAPTLPGHGESIEAFTHVKSSDWVEAAKTACETLINNFEKVDVLGLSLGGLLACHLSTQFKLNHLYLLAPALYAPHTNGLKLAYFLKKLGFNRYRNAAGTIYSTSHCEISYSQLPINTIIEVLTFIKNYAFSLPPCPTDLFLGCHDKVVDSPKIAECFSQAPTVKTHWLKNSSHIIPLDGDLEEVLQCINKPT